MGVFSTEMAHTLSWPAIVLANLLAGFTAGGDLGWQHRSLVQELGDAGRGE